MIAREGEVAGGEPNGGGAMASTTALVESKPTVHYREIQGHGEREKLQADSPGPTTRAGDQNLTARRRR